jgi:membrane associated rhomboid family serine protease
MSKPSRIPYKNSVFIAPEAGGLFRVPNQKLEVAESWVSNLKFIRQFGAGLFPILVVGTTIFLQHRLGGGLRPSSEAIAEYALTSRGLENGWLPLLTSMFLHADGLHLLFNMLGVLMFGGTLSYGLGFFKAILLYLGAGIASGVFGFFAVSGQDATALLGASGAVYGIMIASVLVDPRDDGEGFPWMLLLAALFVLGIPSIHQPEFTNGTTSHAAHLSGAIMGVLLLLVVVDHRYRDGLRKAAIMFIPLLVVVGIFLDRMPKLIRFYRAGAFGGDWSSDLKVCLGWTIGTLLSSIGIASYIAYKGRETEKLRGEHAKEKELSELLEESGHSLELSITDLPSALQLSHDKYFIADEHHSPFNPTAKVWTVEPLVVTCPFCETISQVQDIGPQRCQTCHWEFRVSKSGAITAGKPKRTTCPACKTRFPIRGAGPVACKSCSWSFEVDEKGTITAGKPHKMRCETCDQAFNVTGSGEHPCPRCQRVVTIQADPVSSSANMDRGTTTSTENAILGNEQTTDLPDASVVSKVDGDPSNPGNEVIEDDSKPGKQIEPPPDEQLD